MGNGMRSGFHVLGALPRPLTVLFSLSVPFKCAAHLGLPACADLAAASSSSSRVQPLLSSSSSSLLQGPSECQHCGTYCEWDDESEWEQK